jgi:hypothetical protein
MALHDSASCQTADVLRFRPPTVSTVPREATWPDFKAEEPTTVFSPRPPLRKLVVVIDHELLGATALRRSSASGLLGGLISHPYVEVFRISDDGPPNGIDRLSTKVGTKYVPGWIILGEPSGTTDVPFVQATEDDKSVVRRTLIGNAHELAAADPNSSAYRERGDSEAATQRARDVRALEAAQEAGADLFITERPYLQDLTWEFARQVVVASPESALPLVSLYLRRQGVFLIHRSADGTFEDAFDRGLFYWVGTRDLLSAGWRWFSACVQGSESDDQLVYLGQSLLQRFQRALRDRDAVLWALNQPQDNNTADDALECLDGVLLGLMGAVDVAARVAHRTLTLENKEYSAGWQKEKWLKKVKAAAPGLAAVVAPGSPGAHVLEILRLLRNSIHGAALQPLAISSQSRQREATLVGLPPDDAQRLVAAMDAVGGRSAFGLNIALPDRVHADPGKLANAIFGRTTHLLNQLMRETPVEQLAGASSSGDTGTPPNDDIFNEIARESVRLQLGLEVPELQD